MPNQIEYKGENGFTFRAVIVSSLLTLFLLASSSYIALKIGALPWPIIFSVVMSAGILSMLSVFRKTNVHEINVTQAGASIGGLVASALVFVIPGIWFLQKQGIEIADVNLYTLMIVCVTGGILGILLSIPLRRVFVDKEKLPYPSGTAGAEVLLSAEKGMRYVFFLIFVLSLAGVFALTRDVFFASGFTITLISALGISLIIYPMPLAVGIGYILGKKNAFSWFLGALIGWFMIIPFLLRRGFEETSAVSLVQNLGMGIVLGAGFGFFIVYIIPRIKSIFSPLFRFSKRTPWFFKLTPVFSICALIVLIVSEVHWIAALITVISVWIIAAVASKMTGETNIDPLEQFGIIIGLLCIIVYVLLHQELGNGAAFLIVFFVSVVAAVAGDIGHDYKSAKIVGTRVYDIVRIDLITVILAGICGPLVLEVIRKGFFEELFTQTMPAPQAQLVASSINGFAYPSVFFGGFILSVLIEIVSTFYYKKPFFISMMPFGIGAFLGVPISLMLFIGGLVKSFVKSKSMDYKLTIMAAGLMGGEGIAGFIAAALFVFGIVSYLMAAQILMIVFSLFGLVSLLLFVKKK